VNPERRTAILLGVLLISSIVFGILNTVLALEYPDYLTKLAAIESQVLKAVFFQSAFAVVYVYIAALFYPIIKKRSEGLAIAYFGFRITGAAFSFIGTASLLLLLSLSQSFVSTDQLNSPYFQTLGELLRTGRDMVNHIAVALSWCIGGLILYYCFFVMRLVPKWLSIWGIVGSSLSILSTVMLMLTVIKMATPIYFIMNTPTALVDITLAVFLILKGFKVPRRLLA
jgi:hypothetical protein